MQKKEIDNGKAFDWGKTSSDYARYRDIYPQELYDKILSRGLCKYGQKVLDIGTGTGVLPRNMYKYGAKWVGTDISADQIGQAKALAKESDMDIDFYTCSAENVEYPKNTFDVITACQCIWYPKHSVTAPKFAGILKPGGKFLIIYMGWLPYEDRIAEKSERIILKYNPDWTGFGDTRKHIWIPDEYREFFDVTLQEEFDVKIPFTKDSWHGRVRACRGVGASMTKNVLDKWDAEHRKMLDEAAPEGFEILHYVSIAELTLKK